LKTFYRTISCCIAIVLANTCLGQGKLGAWNIFSFKLNLNKNWSLFQEAQVRSQQFYRNFSYYEIKGGVGYTFKKYAAAIGFGRFMTYSDGDNFKTPLLNEEWRLWEQFLINSYVDRLKIENRARVEQRWTTALGYRNRLKYRLNLAIPINSKKIRPGSVYLTGWDEIYLTDSDPHLETNRIYAGAGYQLCKQVTLQSGFLAVVNYRPDDTHTGKNYLQVTLLVEADAHRQHHEKTPASVD